MHPRSARLKVLLVTLAAGGPFAVPVTAVVHAAYGDSVFIAEPKKDAAGQAANGPDGKPALAARQHFVRLGEMRGDFVAIEEGIMDGQEIVTAGAFAYAKVTNPDVRIIPVVLGVAGFIVGPMLGVFLVGMFTKARGSDAGNIIAITAGLASTIYFGGLHVDLANLIGTGHLVQPPPIKVAFTWCALLGAAVVFVIAVLFPTPPQVLANAHRAREQAHHDDRPMALRDDPAAV